MAEKAGNNENIFSDIGEIAKGVVGKAAAGIKEFGSNVVEKTKEMATNSKLSSERDEKRQELEQHYVKLGKMAYQAGNLTGEMQTVAEQIKQIYLELQQLELKLNEN